MADTDTAPSVASVTPAMDTSTLPNQPPPTMPNGPADAAPKPSLWRGVLAGALQGLAAGSAVNTHGMGTGGAIAAGAGAGANQVLNKAPQQQAEMDQSKMATAVHYANLVKIQRDISLMPATKQEAALNDAADQGQTLVKSGAAVPMGAPSDLMTAQKTLQTLHGQNPWAVYSLLPMRGDDGNMQYAAVQFVKAPLQQDLKLDGQTIPAGTSGEDVGKLHTTFLTKKMDAEAKQNVAAGNQKSRLDVQASKNKGALDVQAMKNEGAAAKASSKPADMAFGTTSDGRQVAGSADELQKAGVQSITKLPGTEAQKVVVARQLIGPRKGLFDMVNNDIDSLAKQGKLGVAASRWGEFMAGKVGDDPEFQALRTHMGLLSTALMQAHVGARGSKDMLQHFKELANYSISNEATLRKALQSEWEYVNEKAMLPNGNPAAGRSGPGQAQAAPSGGQPIYASAPGKPRMMSNDGGKTWQAAQ
jgi:hypothetical protein